MSARSVIGLTAVLLTSAVGVSRAGPPVPAAFKSLKPYQVIEQIMVQREWLSITDPQFGTLDSISLVVRNEKHQFAHQGGKPHNTQHVPMISRGKAFAMALAVLTPEQQERVRYLFPAPAPSQRTPRRVTLPHGKP